MYMRPQPAETRGVTGFPGSRRKVRCSGNEVGVEPLVAHGRGGDGCVALGLGADATPDSFPRSETLAEPIRTEQVTPSEGRCPQTGNEGPVGGRILGRAVKEQRAVGVPDQTRRIATLEERPAAVLEHGVDLRLAPVDAIPGPCVADSGVSRGAPGVEHPPSPVRKPFHMGGGYVAVRAFPRLRVDQAGEDRAVPEQLPYDRVVGAGQAEAVVAAGRGDEIHGVAPSERSSFDRGGQRVVPEK
jgi:hypothetical protein